MENTKIISLWYDKTSEYGGLMKHCSFLIVFILIGILGTVNGQELVTDRPDYTESALAVPSKMIQIESGAEYADLKAAEELSFPNALVRIGVGHNLELRLGFPGWTSISVSNKTESYLNDLLFEVKYQFTQSDVVMPVAVILVSTLPTGDDEVSSGEMEIGLKLAAERDLNERLGLSMNIGTISVPAGDERELLSLASVALGIGVNDKLGAFLEVLAEMPQSEAWQPVLDGGFTYLLSDEAQLDLYAGKGLNDHAPDLIIGAGFSFRFGF